MLGYFFALLQLLLRLDQFVVARLLPLLTIIIEAASLELCAMMLKQQRKYWQLCKKPTHINVFQLIVLQMSNRINKIVLDYILKLILNVSHLSKRFGRVV